jgi:hypothetical protein
MILNLPDFLWEEQKGFLSGHHFSPSPSTMAKRFDVLAGNSDMRVLHKKFSSK